MTDRLMPIVQNAIEGRTSSVRIDELNDAAGR